MLRTSLTRILSLVTVLLISSGCSGRQVIAVATFTPAVKEMATPTSAPAPEPTATELPPTPAPITSPVNITIQQIRMVDAPTGWAVGMVGGNPNDLVLRTSDGGSSWRQVLPNEVFRDAPAGGVKVTPCFLDNLFAWALVTPRSVGPAAQPNATVWRTADGGKSWQSGPLPLAGMLMDYFEPVQIGFSDWQNGWILAHLGQGMGHDYVTLLTTKDGGATWKTIVSSSSENLPTSGKKKGAAFIDGRSGWVSGTYDGASPGMYFWRTRDGGVTWQRQILPVPSGMPEDMFISENTVCGADAPIFLDAQSGVMVVTCSSYSFDQPRSWVYVTFDAGQTWQSRDLPSAGGSIHFVTPYLGWYLGRGDPKTSAGYLIYGTQDSGLTWKTLTPVMWTGDLRFIDAMVGWGVVELNNARALVKTTNGGYSWAELSTTLLP